MEKYALLGRKLSHSWSRPIHERYFQLMGMEASYELLELELEHLEDTVNNMRRAGYKGANVTIPYKVDMMGLMDTVSPEAASIGALNTVKFCDMSGYNTDYFGLEQTLQQFGIDVRSQTVVLLGTGGVSRAVAALCRNKGCNKLTFVSRKKKENAITYAEFEGMRHEGILINCTPVGMYPYMDDSPVADVTGFSAVVDLIYNPVETRLLEMAKSSGAAAVNGLYMLVAQAVCAQAIWNERDVERDIVDAIYQTMAEVAK